MSEKESSTRVSGRDYHDYVIKDGKFVGKFEDMYREADAVPWHQDETAFAIFSNIDLQILKAWKDRLGIESLLEVGCGLGCFTHRLKYETSIKSITGLDISQTAIQKAKKRFAEDSIDFVVGNVASPTFNCARRFDLVLQKEMLWYCAG